MPVHFSSLPSRAPLQPAPTTPGVAAVAVDGTTKHQARIRKRFDFLSKFAKVAPPGRKPGGRQSLGTNTTLKIYCAESLSPKTPGNVFWLLFKICQSSSSGPTTGSSSGPTTGRATLTWHKYHPTNVLCRVTSTKNSGQQILATFQNLLK